MKLSDVPRGIVLLVDILSTSLYLLRKKRIINTVRMKLFSVYFLLSN